MTVDVENPETGAMVRIPVDESLIEFWRESHVDSDEELAEYTREIEITYGELDDWNGRQHMIFGFMEIVFHDRPWRMVMTEVFDDAENASVIIRVNNG
jgi:hypothetical protein